MADQAEVFPLSKPSAKIGQNPLNTQSTHSGRSMNGFRFFWKKKTNLVAVPLELVRGIHPGGAYPPGSDDYAELEKKIEELLAE